MPHDPRVAERREWLAQHARGRTLVLGCGDGRLLAELAVRGIEVAGVEPDASRLAVARLSLENTGASADLVASADPLPYEDATFASVLMERLPREHADRWLHEAARVLAADGTLAVASPLGADGWYPAALYTIVSAHLGVRSIDAARGSLLMVAGHGAAAADPATVLEQIAAQLEHALVAAEQEVRAAAAEHAADHDRLTQRVADLSAEARGLYEQRDALREAVERLREEAIAAKEELKTYGRSVRIVRALERATKNPRGLAKTVRAARRRRATAPVAKKPAPAAQPVAQPTSQPAGLPKPQTRTRLDALRVALIADDRLRLGLMPECEVVTFRPDNGQQMLEASRPHLLLVESASRGNDGAWQYRIGWTTHPDFFGLRDLTNVVEWCRANGVPTMFWNTDARYGDRYLDAARLFDHVFTTDPAWADLFATTDDRRAPTAELLAHAIQPRLHNPAGAPPKRRGEAAFVGSFPPDASLEWRTSVEALLDDARVRGLVVYDPLAGDDERSRFPDRFLSHMAEAVSYAGLADVLRSHAVVLTAPGDDATAMEARACAGALPTHDDTYADRLEHIASRAGLDVYRAPGPTISVLALVDDGDPVAALVDAVATQTLHPIEVLIAGGVRAQEAAGFLARRLPDVSVRVVPRATSYRELATGAGGSWVWPIDAAHHYEPTFLEALTRCEPFAGADVIGLASFEIGTSAGESMIFAPDDEHRLVHAVHPNAAIAKRDLVATKGWPGDLPSAWPVFEEWTSVRFYGAGRSDFRANPERGMPIDGGRS